MPVFYHNKVMIKTFKIHEENLGGVYKIYNLINNRIYIGSTKSFKGRFEDHFKLLRNYLIKRNVPSTACHVLGIRLCISGTRKFFVY